jgi:hypothetical protein
MTCAGQRVAVIVLGKVELGTASIIADSDFLNRDIVQPADLNIGSQPRCNTRGRLEGVHMPGLSYPCGEWQRVCSDIRAYIQRRHSRAKQGEKQLPVLPLLHAAHGKSNLDRAARIRDSDARSGRNLNDEKRRGPAQNAPFPTSPRYAPEVKEHQRTNKIAHVFHLRHWS